MKKLLRNIALLLAPILLYTGLYLYLEPNNFYGLRAETPSGAIFGALRELRQNPTNAIIVGDSRLAHLSIETAQDASGIPFANLSYGGASLVEEIELVRWMLEEYPEIRTVVFGLSFYTLNKAYGQNRMDSIQETMHNPLLYLTNLSYHMDTLRMVPDWLARRPLYGGENETEDPATYTYTEYATPGGEAVTLRTRVAEYLTNSVEPVIAGWELNEEALADLLVLVDECWERDVTITIVLPPMHPALKEYLVDYYGVTDVMLGVVATLRESRAWDVYDYEFTDIPPYGDEYFFDGLHLDYLHGLDDWTRSFFEQVGAWKWL